MFGDFNESRVTVISDHKAKILLVGFQCYGFEQVWKHGGEKLITEKFGGILRETIDYIATEEFKSILSPSVQLILRFPLKDLPKYPSRRKLKEQSLARSPVMKSGVSSMGNTRRSVRSGKSSPRRLRVKSTN